MKDFLDVVEEIIPGASESGVFTYEKGYGRIKWWNGSEAEFWGLDALQSGATTDIKKAEQKLKSHNFTFVWLDQLEEIEEKVYFALLSRMRRQACSHKNKKTYYDGDGNPVCAVCQEEKCGKVSFNQLNATTNPANFWAYAYFKSNPRPSTTLIETSMLDNRENLSEQYIQSELQKPERYVKKYVYGEWSPDSLVESGVFSEDYIKDQAFYIKEPSREFDGVKIFEEPKYMDYQIGVDPSTGAKDPSCIKVICKDTGEEVASFTGFVNTDVVVQKAVQLGLMYSLKNMPLIVPEATGVGQALVELLKKHYSKIYEREVFSQREKKRTKKLGFYTNYSTKEQLLENMKSLFSRKLIKIREREALEEMKTFIYTDEVKRQGAGAQSGYHDDRVMALCLAFWDVKPITATDDNILSRKSLQKKKSVVQYQYQ